MKTKRLLLLFLAISLVVSLCIISAPTAKATTGDYILCESLGTGVPPTTLNGYILYPSLPDRYADVDYDHYEPGIFEHYTIPTVLGDITSNESFWATTNSYIMSEWSHNYAGRVYLSQSPFITLTLPQYVKCFTVYVEPNNGFFCYITAKLNDGITYTQRIRSSDATGFGFTAYGNQYIESVEFTVQDHGGGLVFAELSVGSVENAPFDIQKPYSGEDLSSEFLADLQALYPNYMLSLSSKQNGSLVSLKNVGVYDADVTFTNGNSSETLTFPSALKIIKASPPAPSAPALCADATSIIVTPITDCEYSLDDTNWQDSNVFIGLDPATAYIVYIRYADTSKQNVSISTSASITTDKASQSAPAVPELTADATSIIVSRVIGCEYSLDGTDWQDSNIFNGLKSATQYTIYMRYQATDTLYASKSSSVQITTFASSGINPKTGDNSNPIYLIILMFASFSAITTFIIKRKRQ